MDRLIEWLPQTAPEQERVSVVHGDYRLDNMIFAPDEPRVAAVLDWELSTLGDPLADFTYLLMNWVMRGRRAQRPRRARPAGARHPDAGGGGGALLPATGPAGVPELDWYFAYNLFRLAGILQGIAGRVRDGTAAPRAPTKAPRASPLAEAAWGYAVKAGRRKQRHLEVLREARASKDDAHSVPQCRYSSSLRSHTYGSALHVRHRCVSPPSTGRAWPFTYDASSLARKSPTVAISSGEAARLSGFSWPIRLSLPDSRARSKIGLVIPVSTRPGQIAFTRTPVPAREYAEVCTRLITPALLAE